MKKHKVYFPGTKVKFGSEFKLNGVIDAVNWHIDETFQYRVLFWEGGNRKQIWVCDWELKSNERPKTIGFEQEHGDEEQ